VRIASVAHRLPSRRVDSRELTGLILERNATRYDEAGLRTLRDSLDAYFELTGVRARYWRADGEKAVDLVLATGAEAIAAAGLRPAEIDLLLYVGVGRGWLEPAMANLFLDGLGLTGATGFDLLDACASWLRALDLVDGLMRAGRCRRAVILNGEFNVAEYCEYEIPDAESLGHLLPGFTIGEAATATVLTDDDLADGFHAVFRTWGAHHGLCRIPLPNQDQYRLADEPDRHAPLKFYAYGVPLVQATLRRVVATYHADPRLAGLRPDICFGHSVSETVTTQVERLLRLPEGTAYRTMAEHGNTVSASLPLGMSLALREGALRRGQTVLLVMGSAGISVGLAALTY
jgi:3-oxoacyl-[acyl-carrier-protein] synthase III